MEFKQLITVLALFIAGFSFGQEGFYKIYSGKGYDKGEGAVQLADSGYLVVGTTSSLEDAPSQVLLMRTDKKGDISWSKSYGGPESEEGKRVFNLPGYGFLVAGTSSSGPSRNFDAYIFATDVNGGVKWDTIIDNGGWERIHDARLLKDSTLILVGETDATQSGNKDAWVLAISYDGKLKWKKQLGSNLGDDVYYAIEITSDSTLIIAGTAYEEVSSSNRAVLKCISYNGAFLWEQLYGSGGFYQLNDVTFDNERIKAVGQAKRTGKADKDLYVLITENNGVQIRTDDFYNPNDDSRHTNVLKCKASPQGNMFMGIQQAGGPDNFPEGEDVVIYRSNHDLYFYDVFRNYGGIGQDEVNEYVPTLDGHMIAVGYHAQYETGKNSLFLIKISSEFSFPENSVTVVYDILETESLEKNEWKISPNPANEWLQVDSKLENAHVEVYNMMGELVLNEEIGLSTKIHTNQLVNGMYLLKFVQADGLVDTKRFIVAH